MATKKAILKNQFQKYITRTDAAYARKTDLQELSDAVDAIEVPTKISELDNDKEFQTADDVADAISTAVGVEIASAYKAVGTVAFAELPTPSAANLGNVYNISDDFTASEAFVPPEVGKEYKAGTNVAVVEDNEAYYFDALAGFVDLSGYVEKETGKQLSSEDYTADEKAKLAELEYTTDEEFDAMLQEVFGEEE